MEALMCQWKENIKKNSKIISAILGDILVASIIVFLYYINTGLDIGVLFFMLVISLKPFLIVYINLIMKGEITSEKEKSLKAEQETILLRYKAEYDIKVLKQRIEFLKLNGSLLHDKHQLVRELGYERELSQYKVQVAAKDGKVRDSVSANKDWNNSNEKIRELEEV